MKENQMKKFIWKLGDIVFKSDKKKEKETKKK